MEQSTSIVNFEELLAPISEERPTGIDLREDESPDSVYYKLKDARNAARADERAQLTLPEDQRAESKQWDIILELAPRVLKEQSKDLEVASWYTEALLRRYQLAGLSDGFKLLSGLIQDYWADLYPRNESETDDTKIAPLYGLFGLNSAGTLPQPINRIAITDPKQSHSYAAWQFTQAMNLARAPNAKARNDRISNGVPTLEKIEAAAKKTLNDFYLNLSAELTEAQMYFDTLFTRLAELNGDDNLPNGSFVKNALTNIDSAIKTIAKHVFASTTTLSTDENLDSLAESNSFDSYNNLNNLSSNTIKQRSEAFITLQTIADFFRTTEPHSPISYAIERVIKWGNMQLPELLVELVEDRMAFDAYCKLTGINIPKPPMQGNFPNNPQMGYNDPMGQQMPYNPGMGGGYPPQPPMPGGNPMFNDTF